MPNAYYVNSSSSTPTRSGRTRGAGEPLQEGKDRPSPAHPDGDSLMPEGRTSSSGLLAWNARITPSAVVTAGILLFFLLALVFLFGFFVGKSSLPLSVPLALEDLMQGGAASPREDEAKNSKPDILEKEKLDFMSTLKGEQKGGVLSETEKDRSAAEKPKEGPGDSESKKATTQQTKEPEVPKVPQFDYVLRVATFYDKEPAQSLSAKLGKNGFKTRVTSVKTAKKTWHYVQVLLRGSAEDLKAARSRLASLSFRDAMVIKEKPVKK